jgi:hypothetical protein
MDKAGGAPVVAGLDDATAFHRTGRLWLRAALTDEDLAILDEFSQTADQPGKRLNLSAALTGDGHISRKLGVLFPGYHAVRAVAFNKTETSNWGVPWHQDRIIAVQQRHDVSGFGNWSLKSGAWHCEPPLEILARMLFVRLHLDPTDAHSGPMEIAVGSHKEGLVAADKAEKAALTYPIEQCLAQRGDVLMLNMLALHRSRPALHASTRRTIRVDFSADHLPPPLTWAT